MTAYSFGDIVLVSLPFTDQTGHKKRPAVVVSSPAYHQQRQDLILMAITGHSRPSRTFGEVPIVGWQQAGLLQPSILKPVLFTTERHLIARRLGKLEAIDQEALRRSLATILEVS